MRSVNCFNPEPHEHDHGIEYFVVDDATGEQVRLIGAEEQLDGVDPQQRIRVTGVQSGGLAGDPGSGAVGGLSANPSASGYGEIEAAEIEFLPLAQGAPVNAPKANGGSNSLTMLSTLLVFISTDTHGCMTAESNARGLLFDNATNANEGMQAVTKGRYGLQLGNGTGVPDDHSIDLTLNVNSADHDMDSIEDLALAKLFTDPAASGGLELNRLNWNRILLFAPDGITNKGFTAYAYYPWNLYTTNGMVSVYGRKYGNSRMNGFIHELGHNYGFNHSSKGSKKYGDRTGIMGLSRDSTRTETYNAVKLFETNWLDTFNSAGTPASMVLNQDITLDLYPLSSDLTVVDETVALQISGTEYFVAYHRDDRPYGFLSQSGDRDKVFVYSRASGSRQRSFQVANLSEAAAFDGSSIEVQFGRYGANNEYATVSIDVADGNAMPKITNTSFSTTQDQAVALDLTATDADGDSPLTYAKISDPANGSLSGTLPSLTYTPNAGFTGSDSFRVSVNDGQISNFDSITVSVTMINDNAPTVNAGSDQSATISGDAPWTPAQLTTAAWYDASDASTITKSGDEVSGWADKSPNGLDLTSISSREPTTGSVTINGTNALDFTNDAMSTASNPFGASVSDAFVIMVHKVDNNSNQGTSFTLTGSGGSRWQAHTPWGGTAYFDTGGTRGANRVNTSYGTTTGDNVLVGYYGSTTDNVQQIYKNASLLVGDASGHSVNTVNNIFVGSDGGSTYQDISIGEMIIINGTVSAADRQKLEGYLAHKWGLAANLPVDHPYKAAPPGGAGASVELAGSASDQDGNPLNIAWSKVIGVGSVGFSDASAPATTAFFGEVGTYVLRLTADDGFFQTSDDITITVTEESVADSDGDGLDDAWEVDNFGNLSQGPNDDFDDDGLSNLLERAFGTSPSDSDSRVPMPEGAMVEDGGAHYMSITYRRRIGGTGATGDGYTVDGLTYTVEYDADLTDPWSTGSVVQHGDAIDNSDGTETVTVRLTTPIGNATRQFMRLEVNAAP